MASSSPPPTAIIGHGPIPTLRSETFMAHLKVFKAHQKRIVHGHPRRLLSLKRKGPSLSYGELLDALDGLCQQAEGLVVGLAVARRLVEAHQFELFRRLNRALDGARAHLEDQRQRHDALYRQSLGSTDAALVAHLPNITGLLRQQVGRLGLAAWTVLEQIGLCTVLIAQLEAEQVLLRRAHKALRERVDGRLEALKVERQLGGESELETEHLEALVKTVDEAVQRVLAIEAQRAAQSQDVRPLLKVVSAPEQGSELDAASPLSALVSGELSRAGLERWLTLVEGRAVTAEQLPQPVTDSDGGALQDGIDAVLMVVKARAADEILRLTALMDGPQELERAVEMQTEALATLRQALGPEHPNTLRAMAHLALCHQRRGQLQEARAFYERAWEEQRRVLGEDHPDAWRSAAGVARLWHMTGQTDRAIKLQARIVKWHQAFMGHAHPESLDMLEALAAYRWAGEHRQGAVGLAERLVKLSLESVGEDADVTLERMDTLAQWLRQTQRPEDANVWLRRALRVRLKTLGPADLQTQQAMERCARALKAGGDAASAVTLLRQLVTARQTVMGLHHPQTTLAQWLLRSSLRSQGSVAQANEVDASLSWLLRLDEGGLTDLQRSIRSQLK